MSRVGTGPPANAAAALRYQSHGLYCRTAEDHAEPAEETMKDPRPSYTEDEIHSYLPLGWAVVSPEGQWDVKNRVLTLTVVDNVEFAWPVQLSAEAVRSHGRLGALEKGMDLAFRDRLGRHTRGLGLAG
jgi:hypothetical protein